MATTTAINKALAHQGDISWENFCNAQSKPNACIYCAARSCTKTGQTQVKTKKSTRVVNHQTGLTLQGYQQWVQAIEHAKEQAKRTRVRNAKQQQAHAVQVQPAPVQPAPVQQAPVQPAAFQSAPVQPAQPSNIGLVYHTLNEIADFQSLTPSMKTTVSAHVLSSLPRDIQGRTAQMGDIRGWDDQDWQIVEPIAKGALEFAKQIKSAHRPHAPRNKNRNRNQNRP
jgi:hypothetical protein